MELASPISRPTRRPVFRTLEIFWNLPLLLHTILTRPVIVPSVQATDKKRSQLPFSGRESRTGYDWTRIQETAAGSIRTAESEGLATSVWGMYKGSVQTFVLWSIYPQTPASGASAEPDDGAARISSWNDSI